MLAVAGSAYPYPLTLMRESKVIRPKSKDSDGGAHLHEALQVCHRLPKPLRQLAKGEARRWKVGQNLASASRERVELTFNNFCTSGGNLRMTFSRYESKLASDRCD